MTENSDLKGQILEDYDENKNLYDDLGIRVESLIKELLIQNQIFFHTVSSRLKEKGSLRRKIDSPKGIKYEVLNDITDVCGVRIITYFVDQLPKIEKILKREFSLIEEVDKGKTLKPDQFGYLSHHYIFEISDKRSKLVEYKRFSNLRFEIQLRSILQHAWAEIEHDLGYKSEFELPRQVRRDFSLLAAQLESADSQFVRLRREIAEYSSNLRSIASRNSERVFSSGSDVFLDNDSIEILIKQSKTIKEIDSYIVKITKNPYESDPIMDTSALIERFSILGIERTDQLEDELVKNKLKILKFSDYFYKDFEVQTGGKFRSGVSLFIFAYFECARRGDEVALRKMVSEPIYFQRVLESYKNAIGNTKNGK
jgi:putative GTP pyrophosphokinase